HSVKRAPPVDTTWNEWGFFDYSSLHPNLHSHNVDALAFASDAPVDVIYSVSVVEHMPRAVWERLLERCRAWLPDGGRLLLTIDLIPGTHQLWNFSEGREVESASAHGNVSDFLQRLRDLDFTISETLIKERIPQSRTDV